MLQYTTIDKTTLELLKALMQEECLEELNPKTIEKISWQEVKNEIQKQMKQII